MDRFKFKGDRAGILWPPVDGGISYKAVLTRKSTRAFI